MIVLVRHGETEWSRDGRHTGRTDLELTPQGRVQAEALAPALKAYEVAHVLVSPLRRARDTAVLAGLTPDRAPVTIDDDLVEWDYGEIEGRTTAELRASDPTWNVFDHPCPGGETLDQVAARVDRVLDRCRAIEGDTGGNVAVVAHAHLLRVVGARWVGLPAIEARHLRLDTAAWCELSYEREWPVINRWNLVVA